MVYILIYVCVRACVRGVRASRCAAADAADDSPSHTIHRYRTHSWCDVSLRVFYHETHDEIVTQYARMASCVRVPTPRGRRPRRSTARARDKLTQEGNKTTRSVGHAADTGPCLNVSRCVNATPRCDGVARQHRARRASRTSARERRQRVRISRATRGKGWRARGTRGRERHKKD